MTPHTPPRSALRRTSRKAPRRTAPVAGLALAASLLVPASLAGPAHASAPAPAPAPPPSRQPVATGSGGAVSTVDPDASRTALEVLRQGGNAMDAAIAAGATLGVTEPYVAAIGGGGYLTYYDAKKRRVYGIDGRETAPGRMSATSFVDPATGKALPFDEAVTSGLGVGVPGTLAQWQSALRRFGTRDLGSLLRPAARIADKGFVVDQEFHDQTAVNEARFRDIVPTRELFLPGGKVPAVGSTFRNPDLARTYREIARRGPGWLYRGGLGAEVARTVRKPPVDPKAARKVRPGLMEPRDLAAYGALSKRPTRVSYRGMDVYGMPPSSSGGSTVGEALNILGNFHLDSRDPVRALHYYLEASKLAYADRGRYVGDPAKVAVPLEELLSSGFARERACLIKPDRAAAAPVAPGSPDGSYTPCVPPGRSTRALAYEGPQTTHLVVADKWGNVVAYNVSIEQFGGSGITVPGRGFLLNNELTDFTLQPPAPGSPPDPNLPGPGKRPRSSMAPTLVLKDGRPRLALGTPGGSTIITTVLQILLNRIDLGMDLPAALAAPRATQRNTPQVFAEPAFIERYGRALAARGHRLEAFPGPPQGVIGAATALEILRPGVVQAVAEPVRRGGGSALVVRPGR
ncbi:MULTISPECIES: gamma-glutamyltransferase [Actinomadura]|uniref:Glutathione hydrolase proenzyme n=1 Tax=Actinomadura yumaensis TaxID=111807 RepID=A0ABW2CHI6_9ACTN|nr:gamma-glutamyltransferase [Actinomadura sp. J1-007]MWK33001.1 gamma-glutamyltransferase [Actinomadura sp. J1-007]